MRGGSWPVRGSAGSAALEYVAAMVVAAFVVGAGSAAFVRSEPEVVARAQDAVCRVLSPNQAVGCAAEGGPDAELVPVAVQGVALPAVVEQLPAVVAGPELDVGPAAATEPTIGGENVTCAVTQRGEWEEGDTDVEGDAHAEYQRESGLCSAGVGAAPQYCARVASRDLLPGGVTGPVSEPLWACEPVGSWDVLPATAPEGDIGLPVCLGLVPAGPAVAVVGGMQTSYTQVCADAFGDTRQCEVDRTVDAAGGITYTRRECSAPLSPVEEELAGKGADVDMVVEDECGRPAVAVTPELAATFPATAVDDAAQFGANLELLSVYMLDNTGYDPRVPAENATFLQGAADLKAALDDPVDPTAFEGMQEDLDSTLVDLPAEQEDAQAEPGPGSLRAQLRRPTPGCVGGSALIGAGIAVNAGLGGPAWVSGSLAMFVAVANLVRLFWPTPAAAPPAAHGAAGFFVGQVADDPNFDIEEAFMIDDTVPPTPDDIEREIQLQQRRAEAARVNEEILAGRSPGHARRATRLPAAGGPTARGRRTAWGSRAAGRRRAASARCRSGDGGGPALVTGPQPTGRRS